MRWEPWKSEAKKRRVSFSLGFEDVLLRNRDIESGPLSKLLEVLVARPLRPRLFYTDRDRDGKTPSGFSHKAKRRFAGKYREICRLRLVMAIRPSVLANKFRVF